MVKRRQHTGWGDWVWRRTRFVGIATQVELAARIGCTHNQVCRWLNATDEAPPMRKGFDRRLAEVLKVDRRILFGEWTQHDPVSVPVNGDAPNDAELRKDIVLSAAQLRGERLRLLADTAKGLRTMAVA